MGILWLSSSSSEAALVMETVTEQLLLAGVDEGLGGGEVRLGVVRGGEWNNLLAGDKLGDEDLLRGVEDDLASMLDLAGVEVAGTAGGKG